MRGIRRLLLGLMAAMAVALPVWAQPGAGIAPLPAFADDPTLKRITPVGNDADASMLSTRPAAPAPAPAAPVMQEGLSALPWQAPAAAPAAPAPAPQLPAKIPFGRADAPLGVEVPAGPRTTVAAPVGGVDEVEVSEPAPPEPPAPGADPVKEDASMPTEFTSPIFDGVEDSGGPRRIVFRALNKVTAQAVLFKAKPSEMVRFGKLEINAIMCRNSAPTSQTDSAALLDIRERLPGVEGEMKPLFRGWMYASSPSITALEHPIYDVTMVACEIADAAAKAEAKDTKKSEKSADKKKRN